MVRQASQSTAIPFLNVILMVIISGIGPSPACGGGLRDFADGWLLNPLDMALILSPVWPSDPEIQGSDRPLVERNRWGLWVGAGQGQLFSMKDLPLKAVELGIIRRGEALPWSLAGSWECLGEELMVEETGAMRFRLGRNPQTGVRVRTRSWQVAGEMVASSLEASFEGRLFFEIGARLRGNVAIWLHPWNLPDWHGRSGRRALAEIKLFHPASGVALRIDQRGDGAPVLSLEIMGRLTPNFGLGFRTDPETGSLGGNLVAKLGGPWLHTSHIIHPALGVTHRFHLGLGDPGASVW